MAKTSTSWITILALMILSVATSTAAGARHKREKEERYFDGPPKEKHHHKKARVRAAEVASVIGVTLGQEAINQLKSSRTNQQ
jgi:hypothetical protein